VELITLESVRLAAPEETEEAVATAERIVESETQAFAARQKTRNIDSAIVALRSHTMEVLDEELDKVRSQFGCTAATEQLELAMRRMVKSLLHTPTIRAKQLATQGRTSDYIAALETLYGITIDDR
jgi:glutamyl-tRNA reductase